MKSTEQSQNEQEPIGIVIATGLRAPESPRFWAYVWGPAPEAQVEPASTRAA